MTFSTEGGTKQCLLSFYRTLLLLLERRDQPVINFSSLTPRNNVRRDYAFCLFAQKVHTADLRRHDHARVVIEAP